MSNIEGVCRYCGCSDRQACVLGSDPESGELVTCWWVIEGVCSSPDCVEQAYREMSLWVREVPA